MENKIRILFCFVVVAIILFTAHLFLNRKKTVTTRNYPIIHQSYFSQQKFYDDAFAKVKTPSVNNPVAAVVNHHLFAPNYIAEVMQGFATTAPVSVVLVSPNHFGVGRASILTSLASWQTPYGPLEPQTELIAEILATGLVKVEEPPFEKEHGVSGLVGFIKKAMPNAQIVPLILKNTASLEELGSLAELFAKKQQLIVVASVDFSHYLPHSVAAIHDEISIDALASSNFEIIPRLEVDSPSSLHLLLKFTQDKQARQFTLLQHSDSATKSGNNEPANNTSWITGLFSLGHPKPTSVDAILLTGGFDPSMSTSVFFRQSASFAFADVERLFFGTAQTVYPGDAGVLQPYLDKLFFNKSVREQEVNASGELSYVYRQDAHASADIVIQRGLGKFSYHKVGKQHYIKHMQPLSLSKIGPQWVVLALKKAGQVTLLPISVQSEDGKFVFCQQCSLQ